MSKFLIAIATAFAVASLGACADPYIGKGKGKGKAPAPAPVLEPAPPPTVFKG
jgi:hypothetical protein